MEKRSMVLLFMLTLYAHNAYSTPHFANLMNKREVFCGRKLTDALALVCKGNYNSPSKKSMNDFGAYNEYDEFLFNDNNDENPLDFSFLPKEVANSLLPLRLRRRMGIVDECCRRPCTYKHLSLYCA